MSKKLESMLRPNVLISRTVWSSPQRGEMCHLCKYWVADFPNIEDDPAHKKYYGRVTDGNCGNLRVVAAYKKVPRVHSYYYCNLYKEKENGN
jgi:hypothetical protein